MYFVYFLQKKSSTFYYWIERNANRAMKTTLKWLCAIDADRKIRLEKGLILTIKMDFRIQSSVKVPLLHHEGNSTSRKYFKPVSSSSTTLLRPKPYIYRKGDIFYVKNNFSKSYYIFPLNFQSFKGIYISKVSIKAILIFLNRIVGRVICVCLIQINFR